MLSSLRGKSWIILAAWVLLAVGLILSITYATDEVRRTVNLPRALVTDKPIGGIFFPVIFASIGLAGITVVTTLYITGRLNFQWDLKNKLDAAAIGGLLGSGVAMWYFPAVLIVFFVSLVYLMATRVD